MMNMGGSSKSGHSAACKISMLWNWYTIDTCFIARSWHVRSRGGFAGSCIGVFFLVVASQWLHRFCREYDLAIVKRKELSLKSSFSDSESESEKGAASAPSPSERSPTYAPNPLLHAVGHSWLISPTVEGITPSFFEQLVRSILFMIEWGVSYIIMLLFMYYNGYIIISCILGALVGRFLFTYNEPMSCKGDNRAGAESQEMDRKCCR